MIEWFNTYFKGDKYIWLVIVTLFFSSLLVVYSSTGLIAFRYKGGDTMFYMMRHARFLIIGLVIIYVLHRLPYEIYFKWANAIYLGALVLLVITLLVGVTKNEATRWLEVPGLGFQFQTSDFAKFALIMFIAKHLSANQKSEKQLYEALDLMLWASIIVVSLILPDNFSTAFLLFFSVVLVLIIGRINLRKLVRYLTVIGIVGIFLFVVAGDNVGRIATVKNRMISFSSNEPGVNYQADMAKIAISTGGLTGKGPGKSTQRNFLPQPYSDFIYAIIIEEYGFIGGALILFLYLLFLYRVGRIVQQSKRTFQAFLAIGLGLSLVLQALINMAVAVNLIPVTGQTLPFVSMGGTSIIFSSITFGIILSISRTLEEEAALAKLKRAKG